MPIARARLKISDYRDERTRRVRSSEGRIRVVSLSLTSMVDMFAILVIFLLTNTETVAQWIEVSHDLSLPKARHVETPVQGNTIQLTASGLWLSGKRAADISGPYLESLKVYLQSLPADSLLNVVADEKLPYGKVKQVLATCQGAGFENISLAVQPIASL